jgi:very-short-patch-repair endonuclease
MDQYSPLDISAATTLFSEATRRRLAKLSVYSELKGRVWSATAFLDSTAEIKERCWYILNDTRSPMVCQVCGKNQVRFDKRAGRFRTACSVACARRNPSEMAKKKETFRAKYGVDNPFQSQEIKLAISQTLIDRYGVDHSSKSAAIQEIKRKNAIAKRGVDHHFKTPESIAARSKTMIDAMGFDHYWTAQIPPESLALINDPSWLRREHCEKEKSISQIAQELGVNKTTILNRCAVFGIRPKRFATSKGHGDLFDFVRSIDHTAIKNDRSLISPHELDILVPSRKVAIEFDGIYWHSELAGKSKNYHLDKTLACESKGFQLVHVWENEWELKRPIVLSRIKSILGVNDRVGARRCEVRQISSPTARAFLEKTHIQGYVNASARLGLFHNGVLIACMTFGRPRFNRQYEWELLRYSSELNLNVIGGAGKLFSYFLDLHQPKTIISYADRRYSTGGLYRSLGFTEMKPSGPNFFYFRGDSLDLKSRNLFQKHRLPKILESFDPGMTEVENMRANGYNRIFDCGNRVFAFRRK